MATIKFRHPHEPPLKGSKPKHKKFKKLFYLSLVINLVQIAIGVYYAFR